MPNEMYFRQRSGNGPRVLRKITPLAGQVLRFDSNKRLVAGPSSGSPNDYTANGAIAIVDGTVTISKTGSAAAMTLAAPTVAQDGIAMLIIAATAFAHTVTQTTPGFNNGGAASDVATFGGAVGDNMKIVAKNGVWLVQSLRNVTLA